MSSTDTTTVTTISAPHIFPIMRAVKAMAEGELFGAEDLRRRANRRRLTDDQITDAMRYSARQGWAHPVPGPRKTKWIRSKKVAQAVGRVPIV